MSVAASSTHYLLYHNDKCNNHRLVQFQQHTGYYQQTPHSNSSLPQLMVLWTLKVSMFWLQHQNTTFEPGVELQEEPEMTIKENGENFSNVKEMAMSCAKKPELGRKCSNKNGAWPGKCTQRQFRDGERGRTITNRDFSPKRKPKKKEGALGPTQYCYAERQIGQYQNTASKIDEIPIWHLDPFILGTLT